MADLLSLASSAFEGVLSVIRGDLATVRTGRARPELVENVFVEAYEGQERMKIVELASISAPDPHQLVLKPWDQSILDRIEKALAMADLGVNPVVDGEIIRIVIPMLTEERRRDLVMLVHKKLEAGRNLLRGERQQIKEKVETQKGQPGVSEDDIFRQLEELQKLTEEFMVKIEEMGKVKEAELMQI